MTVVLLVEGDTEAALKQHLKTFLDQRAELTSRPRVRLETRSGINLRKLKHRVELELARPGVTAVVGLIDVFPDFANAEGARTGLKEAAGHHPDFHAHAAQYDVEAWLLPYWAEICRRLNLNRASPGNHPEEVDGVRPPSYRLKELYQLAKRKYVKTTEMFAILQGKDLTVSATHCPEFRALLNTLLTFNGLEPLP